MTPQLETDLRAFVSKPRTMRISGSADNVVGVAFAVIKEFFAEYPAHETESREAGDVMLSTMARELGFDNPRRWLGCCVCCSNGDMIFEIEAPP